MFAILATKVHKQMTNQMTFIMNGGKRVKNILLSITEEPPELPSRPPLPAEMRHLIVEDIAQNKTPNTRNDMLVAERNLELRMQQPAYFDYPTPRQEAVPHMAQVSSEGYRGGSGGWLEHSSLPPPPPPPPCFF